MSIRITTPKFRVSFPSVFEPHAAIEGGPLRYSISMIFDKATDLTEMKSACLQAIKAKWGEDKNKWPSDLRKPFRKGSEKTLAGYDDDTVFVRASSEYRPGVLNEYKEPMARAEDLYAGCYARASLNAYAYDKAGNKGVTFGLNNIIKVADGDRLDSRVTAEEDFANVEITEKPKKKKAPKDTRDDDLFSENDAASDIGNDWMDEL